MASNLFKKFSTNPDAETKGVAIDVGTAENGKPMRFYVARFGGRNTPALANFSEISKPYAKEIAEGSVSSELLQNLLAINTGGFLITGWENIFDEDGAELPFSKDAAISLMKALPDLCNTLRQGAITSDLYLSSNENAIVKN